MADNPQRDDEFGDGVVDGNDETQAELDKVRGTLRKVRSELKATKSKLSAFDGVTPDEVHEKFDRLEELEASGVESGDNDERIQKLVQARIDREKKPLQRELDRTKAERDEFKVSADSLGQELGTMRVRNETRKHLVDSQGRPRVAKTAEADILDLAERHLELQDDGALRTRDGVGVTPDMDPGKWMDEVLAARPHLMPGSSGSGATGSRSGPTTGSHTGANPWDPKAKNITEQMQLMKRDPALAKQLAAEHGKTGIG